MPLAAAEAGLFQEQRTWTGWVRSLALSCCAELVATLTRCFGRAMSGSRITSD